MRTLSFDEVDALPFADPASRVAGLPKVSGDGQPSYFESGDEATLIYSRVEDGFRHMRLCVFVIESNGSLRLKSDVTMPPVALDVGGRPKAVVSSAGAAAAASSSSCKRAVSVWRGSGASEPHDEVTLRIRPGAKWFLHGEELEVRSVKRFNERKDLLGFSHLSSALVSFTNGLCVEVEQG